MIRTILFLAAVALVEPTGVSAQALEQSEIKVLGLGLQRDAAGGVLLAMRIAAPEGAASAEQVARDTCSYLDKRMDSLLTPEQGPRPERVAFQIEEKSTFLMVFTSRKMAFYSAEIGEAGCLADTLVAGAPVARRAEGS